MKIILLLTLLSITVLLSCGSKTQIQGTNAQSLYENTMDELTSDQGGFPWIFNTTDYNTVEEQLKEIQIRYTYSPYATLAELRTADLYFKQGEYKQAAIEYEEFLKRHPSHNGAQYALYFLGLSNYKLIKGRDRSQKSSRETIKWFSKYINEYPDSPLVNDARLKIKETNDVLAEHELYVGNFYAGRNNHKAAVERFKAVIDLYSNSKHVDEALYLLGKSYIEMNENDLALLALNRIINEMPDSDYNDDAVSLVSTIK